MRRQAKEKRSWISELKEVVLCVCIILFPSVSGNCDNLFFLPAGKVESRRASAGQLCFLWICFHEGFDSIACLFGSDVVKRYYTGRTSGFEEEK